MASLGQLFGSQQQSAPPGLNLSGLPGMAPGAAGQQTQGEPQQQGISLPPQPSIPSFQQPQLPGAINQGNGGKLGQWLPMLAMAGFQAGSHG